MNHCQSLLITLTKGCFRQNNRHPSQEMMQVPCLVIEEKEAVHQRPSRLSFLEDVLVCEADGTDIAVVGCAEWESERFNGVTRLHVSTLDKFHGKHRWVW